MALSRDVVLGAHRVADRADQPCCLISSAALTPNSTARVFSGSGQAPRSGEISRELETAKHGPGRGNKSLPNDGKPFKSEALAAAGISTTTANRFEEWPAVARSKARKRQPRRSGPLLAL